MTGPIPDIALQRQIDALRAEIDGHIAEDDSLPEVLPGTVTSSDWLLSGLRQVAVYWGTPVNTGAGDRTFAVPVEIRCRWMQKAVLFIDQTGQEKVSNAVVMVDRDLDLGGYVHLGTLADLSSAEELDPLSIAATYEIRALGKSPTFRANDAARKVML